MDYLYLKIDTFQSITPLNKIICQNTSPPGLVFSRYGQNRRFCSIYGKTWARENPHSGIVEAVLNVTHLIYVGQAHPTWTIFRSPTFDFS